MRLVVKVLSLLMIASSFSTAVHGQNQQLTDAEKARIKDQIKGLKDSKLKDAENANKNLKEQALRQGKAIDDSVKQQSDQIDKAVENVTPRFGVERTNALGNMKKKELLDKANAEKEKVATGARKKAATTTGAAKKAANGVDESIDGLKSQVTKPGQYGLKPKGSNMYVRNYSK